MPCSKPDDVMMDIHTGKRSGYQGIMTTTGSMD